MKREKKSYPLVEKYKSIFHWRECRFCNKEFKKEYGFIIKEKIKEYIIKTYCCNDCAESIDEVKVKLKEQDKKAQKDSILYTKYMDEDFDDDIDDGD